jgi:opacity protein-like surface antigen
MMRMSRGIAATVVVLLMAGQAEAQVGLGPFRASATGRLGASTGAGLNEGVFTGSASIAVLESEGAGAEFDAGFQNGDDAGLRAKAQTYMLNFMWRYPKGSLRPYFVAGGGAMRVQGCRRCGSSATFTDFAFGGGGGAQYFVVPMLAVSGDVRYLTTLNRSPLPARNDGYGFWRISAGVSLLWDMLP